MQTPKFRTRFSKKSHKHRADLYAAAYKILTTAFDENSELYDEYAGLCFALEEATASTLGYTNETILKAELAEAVGFDLIDNDDGSFWPVFRKPDTEKGRQQRLDLLKAAEAYHQRRAKSGT